MAITHSFTYSGYTFSSAYSMINQLTRMNLNYTEKLDSTYPDVWIEYVVNTYPTSHSRISGSDPLQTKAYRCTASLSDTNPLALAYTALKLESDFSGSNNDQPGL